MTNPIAVIKVAGGEVTVEYSEGVNVTVINMDADELYLYKNTFICTVEDVNDDGTLNLVCVDTSDGSSSNRSFYNVPVADVEFYGEDVLGEYIDTGDDW